MKSSSRQTTTPLLERRAREITNLRTEVATLKARVAELEAELAAAKKKL